MLHLDLIYPGKTRETYLADGIEDFSRRLRRLHSLRHTVVRSPKKQGQLSVDAFKKREGAQLLDAVDPASFLVVLDDSGRMMDSEKLARFLLQQEEQGKKKLSFVIGGYLGLSADVVSRADLLLSLSPMTFTHEMCRLFLVEQLYRAATLNANIPYHL